MPPYFVVYIFCLLFLHFFALFSTFFFANNMNNYRDEHNPCCYFHPKEVVVGICALCLRERLLNLASKQGHLPICKDSNRSFRVLRRPRVTLPKVFALGSFLHRLESRRMKPDDYSDQGSVAGLEDSFISIKFEDNGQATWESKKENVVADPSTKETKGGKSMVEHVKPRGMLRWRKRIGQLLQMTRWKRSSMVGTSHVGLAGNVEGRRWWMRSQ